MTGCRMKIVVNGAADNQAGSELNSRGRLINAIAAPVGKSTVYYALAKAMPQDCPLHPLPSNQTSGSKEGGV